MFFCFKNIFTLLFLFVELIIKLHIWAECSVAISSI